MGIYTFTFEKLKKTILNAAAKNDKIEIAFIERHSDNNTEMLANAESLCKEIVSINANHLFFNFNNNDAMLCIEDFGKIDVSEQCLNVLTKVKEEFHDDFIDDETSSWKMVILYKKDLYELTVSGINILTNEEEAIIQCRGCKRKNRNG